MRSKRTVVFATIMLVLVPAAFALEPVVIAGTDVAFTGSSFLEAQRPLTELRPRLGLSWRGRLEAGGYVSVDARAAIALRVTEPSVPLSDGERVAVRLLVPAGSDELLFGAGVESSFVGEGTARARVVPDWSADYRFITDDGWVAVRSSGLYRYSADGDDLLSQRIGIGFVGMESIRFSLSTDVWGGYEIRPDSPLVNASGATIDETRRDVTARLDGRAEGLWGYFTTWSLSGALAGRFSNATNYLASVAEFESDSESRLTTALSGSLETSPVRQLGLSASASARNAWYLGRPARNESDAAVVPNLDVLAVDLALQADYNPVPDLYFVGSVAAGSSFSADPDFRGWQVTGSVGVEYSF